MCPRPVIGVPADRRILQPHPFHMVGEKYLQALIDGADALPMILPVLAEHIAIDDILRNVDGILLTGSPSNVEPHHYAGEPSDPGTLHDPHRDAVTLPLTRRVLDAGVPLLAVCRGFQELVVVLGGSLHQKVHEVAGYHVHKENPDDSLDVQYGPSHEVNLVEGGLLHGLAGTSNIMVNSLHSQGLARLPDGVTVEAVADDGLIEGFRVDSAPGFALAVQWHPEWQASGNEFSMSIFKAFGAACRAYAKQQRG
ncbi:MAG: gamma-glutamyl-gamma-aminobutyrate hydrolase family protein [Gammaproteobacteria bacterium]|nr:gamma-glutamyl-gamma-aminobutyrate hydrolase family protein [Gammaproteobacteria bacterium]